ncbi:tyrosine-type recombinase/integrase [Marilutibacter spongiae]|uniref:Site-specific integrase n=1 Tax=Marilutibacter spongiae TaxID=2025720 RepID=A0A7W3TP22_9GAMM|nr:site-specific integrase [Lysobacter spongiae]MBB1061865.1 site-specific integrase [Lysobacter spongiae]
MASIVPYRNGWRVQIKNRHGRDSATFRTKREAAQWALQREAEISGTKVPDKSLAEALDRYKREVSPEHKGARWEALRLDSLSRHPIARTPVAELVGPDVAEWRDDRLREVAPATVAREMTLLRSVLEVCRRDWGWIRTNPMTDVRRPRSPPSRKRRITPEEVERVAIACDLVDGDNAETALQRTGLAFLFALETAMRAGEILRLRWEDIGNKSVTLSETKNGDARRVPLSPRAREIVAALPQVAETAFNLHPGTRDALWRKAVQATKIEDLHFHDSRAEAIWRLSKKLDVMELARVIGHRDLKSLMIYYQADADELADRL